MAPANNPSVSKYFIALVPPAPIQDQVSALKEEIKEKYNASASFNSPAHLTLMMPFEFKETKKPALISLLQEFVQTQASFEVSHDGFGCFEPRVLFVRVDANEDLLSMQRALGTQLKSLRIFEKNYKNQAYRPHMTIAFRDLRKALFYQAWEAFKERAFQQSWNARTLCLLKREEKIWQIDQEFSFKTK